MRAEAFLALAATEEGRVFHLQGDPLPWLFPSLAVFGLALQFAALLFNNRSLLLAGFAFVAGAAFFERDIALAVGDILATLAVWICLNVKIKK